MAAVRMFIDKFNGVVLIQEDHPLAVAQRTKDAVQQDAGSGVRVPESAVTADTSSAIAPAATMPPVSPVTPADPPLPRRSRRSRRRE